MGAWYRRGPEAPVALPAIVASARPEGPSAASDPNGVRRHRAAVPTGTTTPVTFGTDRDAGTTGSNDWYH